MNDYMLYVAVITGMVLFLITFCNLWNNDRK